MTDTTEIKLLDIADELLIINKATIERLFQEENTDVLVLYMFYYKTAKWQKHNPIKASDEYCQKCLSWGLKRVKNVKKELKDMGLISVEKRLNEKQQIDGWYVRINYYINYENSSGSISSGSIPPLVAKRDHNILINNNINTINNKKEIHKESYFNSENLDKAIKEWLEYKKERKDKPYTEIGLKKLLTQIKNNVNEYGEQQVVNLIDECMGNNYKGIIFDKLKKQSKKEDDIVEWF